MKLTCCKTSSLSEQQDPSTKVSNASVKLQIRSCAKMFGACVHRAQVMYDVAAKAIKSNRRVASGAVVLWNGSCDAMLVSALESDWATIRGHGLVNLST